MAGAVEEQLDGEVRRLLYETDRFSRSRRSWMDSNCERSRTRPGKEPKGIYTEDTLLTARDPK